ncbi:hypothetical protein [Dictyobacter kobayashii]|uniref:Uncharacterized protein n=1 Tax=Dictyobacter kobayashii TaxID=2014872 RepID=A0A402AW41_9CHLR|nr:hypothetical protein [Dictyobacter kobayashii]GCE23316.1 hypothetical protein KDK_71160 [Dictyobacter kobayashii]
MGSITNQYISFMAPKFVSEDAEMYMQQSIMENQGQPGQRRNHPQGELSVDTAQLKGYEQVDPYTLDIIAKLFPSGGLEFLALVLRHATIKQEVLPGLGKLGENVAVISTRTLRTLANTIKWGYDTTHKYVVVFCALNLLRKSKHNKELQIIFPLGKYQPPQNLHALDSLIIHSRPKVQQFTRKVKERILQFNLLFAPQVDINEALELSECDPRLQQVFFNPMLEIIKSEGIDAEKGQRIVFRMVSEVLSKILFPKLFTSPAEASRPRVEIVKSKVDSDYYQITQNIRNQISSLPESTNSQTKGRLEPKKVYPEGRLFPEVEKVAEKFSEKSTETEKSTLPEQKVYPAQQMESTLQPLTVDSITELLYVYNDLLEDPQVDWEKMGLPKDFFEELYAQIHAYYTRLHNRGLLAHTKGHIWKSVEISIIKKLAMNYGVDQTNACTYVFLCTGREYQPPVVQPTKVYPAPMPETKKKLSRDQLPEDWYQPPTDRCDQKVDFENIEEDSFKKKSSARKTFSDNRETKSPQAQKAEDYLSEKSTGKVDFSPAQLNSDDAKHLRIPTQLDSESYGEDFYNVIRKRNINILFNKINNNVTLRSDAAKFLTRLFDNNDNAKVQKQNENLLKKYKPEVITTAFIDTVLSMHEPGNDSLQNPGAYFTSRCKHYQNNAADDETESLVKIYSSMNYDELVAEMKIVLNCEKKLRTKPYRGRSQT